MNFDLNAQLGISYKWEALILSDGSLFFNSILGNHLSVNNPPKLLIDVIEAIGLETLTVETLLHKLEMQFVAINLETIKKLLTPLIDSGIILYHRNDTNATEHRKVRERFHSQFEWLIMRSGSTDSAIEAFNAIQKSRVLIIGQGALGGLLARTLAAAGVGYLKIVDGDTVEEGNLTRQILFNENDLGAPKVACMARDLENFNSETTVEPINQFIRSQKDLAQVIQGIDLVVLTADSPRFIIENWVDNLCKEFEVAYVMAHAGTVGPFFIPGKSGCFVCVEKLYEREFGESKYRQIAEALSRPTTWRYPSFAGGSLRLGGILLEEIVGFLGGFDTPVLNKNLAHVSRLSTKLIPLESAQNCSCFPELVEEII